MRLKDLMKKFYATKEEFIFLRRSNWLKGYLYRVDRDGDIRDFDDVGVWFDREGFQRRDWEADDWEVVDIDTDWKADGREVVDIDTSYCSK